MHNSSRRGFLVVLLCFVFGVMGFSIFTGRLSNNKSKEAATIITSSENPTDKVSTITASDGSAVASVNQEINVIINGEQLTGDLTNGANDLTVDENKETEEEVPLVNCWGEIQHTDAKLASNRFKLYQINGNVTDFQNNFYSAGFIFYNDYDADNGRIFVDGDSDNALMIIEYDLKSQYKSFSGKIVLPKGIEIVGLSQESLKNENQVDVLFYGDGKLLDSKLSVSNDSFTDFSLDVLDINTLTIKVIGNSDFSSGTSHVERYTALVNPVLYK